MQKNLGTFDATGMFELLSPELLRAIAGAGFDPPHFPVQVNNVCSTSRYNGSQVQINIECHP